MIYFIKAGGTVKIGYTAGPKTLDIRVATLQTGNAGKLRVLGTMEGTLADEIELHRRFARHRLHGEWFVLCDEIRAFIQSQCGVTVRMRPTAWPAFNGLSVLTNWALVWVFASYAIAAVAVFLMGYDPQFQHVDWSIFEFGPSVSLTLNRISDLTATFLLIGTCLLPGVAGVMLCLFARVGVIRWRYKRVIRQNAADASVSNGFRLRPF